MMDRYIYMGGRRINEEGEGDGERSDISGALMAKM